MHLRGNNGIRDLNICVCADSQDIDAVDLFWKVNWTPKMGS
jgi:hypothetical protein